MGVNREISPGLIIETKRALVTGASRGIGRAIALELAQRGVVVTLLARHQAPLDQLRDEIERAGGKADTIVANLAVRNQLATVAQNLVQSNRTPNILINNAGVTLQADLASATEKEVANVIDVNLLAPILLTRALLPAMLAQGKGAIVNISSLAGLFGSPRMHAYCASKSGLNGFTEALAHDLADTPLNVTVVHMPAVNTARAGRSRRRIPVSRAAKEVARAIERGQEEVFIGWEGPMAWRLKRFLPRVARFLLRRRFRSSGRRPSAAEQT